MRRSRKALLELTKRMRSEFCDSPVLEAKMLELAKSFEAVKGKKVYGYLKKSIKTQVDAVVDPSTYIHTQKYRASAIRTPPAH